MLLVWKIALGLLLTATGLVALSIAGALALGYAVTMNHEQRDVLRRR
jgi:hypothetical protein